MVAFFPPVALRLCQLSLDIPAEYAEKIEQITSHSPVNYKYHSLPDISTSQSNAKSSYCMQMELDSCSYTNDLRTHFGTVLKRIITSAHA